ncbi:MAG: filamin/ABP280 repeat domain-containing protein, partial [Myxococcota bacterium]|nr:filamin/ABP280 repeat domain-containing protein [Myxococcota bacterium]
MSKITAKSEGTRHGRYLNRSSLVPFSKRFSLSIARRTAAIVALVGTSLIFSTCKLDDLVTPPEPSSIGVSLPQVVDSAAVGSTARHDLTVEVTASGDGRVTWNARKSNGSAWLVLSANSGTAPGSVTISTDPADLAVGEYHDTLLFSVGANAPDPTPLPVRYVIHPCLPNDFSLDVAVTDSLVTSDCGSSHGNGQFAKLFEFDANGGDSVTVVMTSTDLDAYLFVDSLEDGSAPSLVDGDDCLGEEGDACLVYVLLPDTGSYFIGASSASPQETGVFSLEMFPPRDPDAAADLMQLRSDSSTSIATGEVVFDSAMVIAASVSDPDLGDSLKLLIEIRPVGTDFTGIPTDSSPIGSTEDTLYIDLSDLTDDTEYHWQARASDQTGRVGAWVAFGGNAEDAPDFTRAVQETPRSIAAPGQFGPDSVTTIGVGATTGTNVVVLKATVADPDPDDSLSLEVELRPVGTAFNGTATSESPRFANGQIAVLRISGLSDDTQYHWQARAVDTRGAAGPWSAFGGNAESEADFSVSAPQAPGDPTDLNQTETDSTSVIPVGATISASSVVLSASISDPDPGDSVRLQVEVRPVGTSFTGPTGSSPFVVGSGTAYVLVSGLTDDTEFRWRARTVDGSGATSAWVYFGNNGDVDEDFRVSISAAQLVFTVQPSNTVAGEEITPDVVVTAREPSGQADTSFNQQVTLSITPGTGASGAVLGGTTTVTASRGVAVFSNLFINLSGSAYGITGTSAGLPDVASASFDILTGPPDHLAIATQPSSSSTTGVPLAQQPSIQIEDAQNNPVLQQGVTVTAVVASGPSGATLTGETASTNVIGLATFAGLTLSGSVGTYTLEFQASGITSVTSESIGLSTGGASAATSTATVPDGVAGSQTNIVVQVRDASGNDLSVGGETVVVSVTGANSVSPTVTDNNDGTYSASYVPVNSGTDNVAITLNSVAISGSPYSSSVSTGSVSPAMTTATVPNGLAGNPTDIVVQARDGSGNAIAVGGETVTVTVAGANSVSPGVSDAGDGTYTASYTPTNAGTDNVTITMNGTEIGGSPFSSVVAVGAASPALTVATVPAGVAGEVTTITVQSRDASGNDLTTGGEVVVVAVTGANTAIAAITDNDDGTYSATYTPTITGTDDIDVQLNGTSIGSSPFTSAVAPSTANASQSRATVPAGEAGAVTTITVQARDAYGNNLQS